MLKVKDFMIVGIDWNDQKGKLGVMKCSENMRCSCMTIVTMNLYRSFCIARMGISSLCALCFTRRVLKTRVICWCASVTNAKVRRKSTAIVCVQIALSHRQTGP